MAEYDANRTIRLEGVVTEVDFVNPHAEIAVDAGSGCWRVELSSPAALLRRGVSKTSIRAGMHVRIDAYPSKDRPRRAYGLDLTLPDGRVLRLNAGI